MGRALKSIIEFRTIQIDLATRIGDASVDRRSMGPFMTHGFRSPSDAQCSNHDRRRKPEVIRLLEVVPSEPCVKARLVERHKIQLRKSESTPFCNDTLR